MSRSPSIASSMGVKAPPPPTLRPPSRGRSIDHNVSQETIPLEEGSEPSERRAMSRTSSRSPSPHPKPLRPQLHAALAEGYRFTGDHVATISSWCGTPIGNFKLLYESTYANGSQEGITRSSHGCLPLFIILSTEDDQIIGGFHTSTLLKGPSFIFKAVGMSLRRHLPVEHDKLKKRVTIDTPTCFANKDLVINPSSGIVSSVFDRYQADTGETGLLAGNKTTGRLRCLHIFWGVPVEELALVVLAGGVAVMAPPPKRDDETSTESSKADTVTQRKVVSRPKYSYAEGCIAPAPAYTPPPPQPYFDEEEEEEDEPQPSEPPQPSSGYGPYSGAYAMHTYMPAYAAPERRLTRSLSQPATWSPPIRRRSNSVGSSLPSTSLVFTEKRYSYKPLPAVEPPEFVYYGTKLPRKPSLPVEATRYGKKNRERRAATPPPSKQRLFTPAVGPSGIMGGGKIHWASPGGWETRLCDGRSAKYDSGVKKKKKKKVEEEKPRKDVPVWREEVEALLMKERQHRPVVCPVTGLTYKGTGMLDVRRDLANRALLSVGVPESVLLYNYYDGTVHNDVAAEQCSQQWLLEVLNWAEGTGGPRFRDEIHNTWRNCLDDELMWQGQVLSPPRVDRRASDPDVFRAYFAKRHPSVERGERITLQKNCHAGCVRLTSRRSSATSNPQSLNPTLSILDFTRPTHI
eukprot:TRINITY_DN8757_c0_g3_i1.p1 TRINITY_DN8757_c0_g3~~TRINITY_DN8757_c0_g3_i1.p1  ORF type:complete len:722 (+),score=151.05 TRINITY_DN8757_c0_g3_i1:106-2166(+)